MVSNKSLRRNKLFCFFLILLLLAGCSNSTIKAKTYEQHNKTNESNEVSDRIKTVSEIKRTIKEVRELDKEITLLKKQFCF